MGEPRYQCSCCRPVGDWLLRLQILFLDAGLLMSLYAGYRIALGAIRRSSSRALAAFAPWGVLIVLLFAAAVWIVFQPMQMRGTLPGSRSDHAARDRPDSTACVLIAVLASISPRGVLMPGWLPQSPRSPTAVLLRLSEKKGNYRISAFTAPNPFRAGPVEISVLVQDAATGDRIARRESRSPHCPRRAALRRATIPGDHAATRRTSSSTRPTFDLRGPGWWTVAIDVDGPQGAARDELRVEAADRLPRWLSMWPWFSWPFLSVLLFALHQAFAVSRTPSRPTPAPRRSPQPRHE